MVLKRRLGYLAAAVIAGCTAGTIGCGGSPSSPSGSGSLRVMLKDSPLPDVAAVLVTFSAVSAHQDTDADFTPLTFVAGTSRTCDMLRLQKNGTYDVLGVTTLDAGHYTQVRLLVSEAKIYIGTDSSMGEACGPGDIAHVTGLMPPEVNPPAVTEMLTIPSGEVKLNREFDVPVGGTTTLRLDFDLDHSVIQTGNGSFMLKPVIGIDSVSNTN